MKVKTVSIDANLTDPESAYTAVKGTNTYLLESAEGGEKIARYSFIGFNPAAKFTMKGKHANLEIFDKSLNGLKLSGSEPLEILKNLLKSFDSDCKSDDRFFGGFVGYFSYDLVRYYNCLTKKHDELKEPDCEFILAKNNIIFDHKAGKTHFVQHEFSECDNDEVRDKLGTTLKKLKPKEPKSGKKQKLTITSNTTQKEFEKMVKKTIEYIKDGDIIQAVISQRFEAEFLGDSFTFFRNLKRINPSPYMYHVDLGDRKIVGSSPEMLARVEGRRVLTYPIAGTRKRGKSEKEDKEMEKELLSDEKELAEHVMLVDLGRNDIGRVAEFGSIRVNKLMGIEKYSHVQHMVSEVEGNLAKGKDAFDAFKSIFPAGTVSGAPKVRAMEIINELEKSRRGIYAGSVGYFSFNGNMDTAISIRTVVFEGKKVYIQAGAGIVADSNPELEYKETENKARAMLAALEGI